MVKGEVGTMGVEGAVGMEGVEGAVDGSCQSGVG